MQVLLATAFLSARGAKLAGVPSMVAVFDQVGIGQWFRYLTGAVEIAGGVLALVPGAAIIGAALLVCTMASAVVTHLTVIGGNPCRPSCCSLEPARILAAPHGNFSPLRIRNSAAITAG